MESQNLANDKNSIKAKLKAFSDLGADIGLDCDRAWVVLDNKSTKVAQGCSQYITIYELLEISLSDFKAFGSRTWQQKFISPEELSDGFMHGEWKKGNWISPYTSSSCSDAPEYGYCLKKNAVDEIEKIRQLVQYRLANQQPSVPNEITPRFPRRLTNKGVATSNSNPNKRSVPKDDTPSRDLSPVPYNNNPKILRQNNMEDKRAADETSRPVEEPTSPPQQSIPLSRPVEEPTPPPTPSISPPTFVNDEQKKKWIDEVAIPILSAHVETNLPSDEIQSLSKKILDKVEDPKTSISTLAWSDSRGHWREQKYQKQKRARALKEDSKKKSQTDLVTRKANEVEIAAEAVFGNDAIDYETEKEIIRKMAKRRELEVFEVDELLLTVDEIASIRDFCGLSSTKMLKFKQALEVLRPALKNCVFVKALKDRLAEFEREGNLPVEVKKMPMIIKKDGNKVDLRIVWWLLEPAKMMEKLINKSIADRKFQNSQEFSFLTDQIVVLWGIDKSTKDMGCTLRVANREEGNSQLHTQLLGGVEDSAECHANLKASFFSNDCPLKTFLQYLVYDYYQVLTVNVGSRVQSFSFTPYPTFEQCTTRKISVEKGEEIDEDCVQFNDKSEMGLPPEIPMLTKTTKIKVNLVLREVVAEPLDDEAIKPSKSKKPTSPPKPVRQLVGFQFDADGTVLYTQYFTEPIELHEWESIDMIDVNIRQINGHVANDYKQSAILAGICSASATCSCVCCLRKKSEFHVPSERLQKLREPDKEPTVKDAPKREGQNSVIVASKRYAEQTGHGKFHLPEEMAKIINVENGSCFYEYLIDIPPQKQNGGILHLSGGWINHFLQNIRTYLRELEEDSPWMKNASSVLNDGIVSILNEYKAPKAGETTVYRELYNQNKELQQKAKDARIEVARLTHQMEAVGDNEDDPVEVVQANERARQAFKAAIDQAEDLAREALKDCVVDAESSNFAHMVLLKKGVLELEPQLSKYLKKNSKKARGAAENAFNQALQKVAGAKFMAEHSGFEQTTGNGINTIKNFSKVADIVESIYPPENSLHQKIKDAFVNFRKVATLLYPFLTYAKSQKKRDPQEFLRLLNPLLIAWDETFPDKMYFLKLHHIMAHLPEFVDRYGMLGRVSEESFESVHALMSRIKDMVAKMHGDQKRIETATAKAQATLKDGVVEARTKIIDGTTGKKRGPMVNKPSRPGEIQAQINVDYNIVVVDGREYFDIPNGKGRLPREWQDLYLMVTDGRVPISWRKVFDETLHLSEDKKQDAIFMKH